MILQALPSEFVRQHADKIGKRVVLQSVAAREFWTVIAANAPCPRNPKLSRVTIYGAAWKAFVVSNSLVEGDQLIFTLVAVSKFEVLILHSGGSSNEVRPAVQGPAIMRSNGSAFSQTWQPETNSKSLGQHHIDWTGQGGVNLESELSSALFVETEDDKDRDTHSASDSSQSPSDMDSHNFDR